MIARNLLSQEKQETSLALHAHEAILAVESCKFIDVVSK